MPKTQVEVINCDNRGFKALKGATLNKKYKLGKIIGQGSQGVIIEVSDGMVAKLSSNTTDLANEINILKKLC